MTPDRADRRRRSLGRHSDVPSLGRRSASGAHLSGPGTVLLAEAYDGGWSATAGGKTLPHGHAFGFTNSFTLDAERRGDARAHRASRGAIGCSSFEAALWIVRGHVVVPWPLEEAEGARAHRTRASAASARRGSTSSSSVTSSGRADEPTLSHGWRRIGSPPSSSSALLIGGLVVLERRTSPTIPTVPHRASAVDGPTVPSSDAVSVAWFCAEGTSIDGGRADETVMIGNLAQHPIEATITVMPRLPPAASRSSGERSTRSRRNACSCRISPSRAAGRGRGGVRRTGDRRARARGHDDVAVGPVLAAAEPGVVLRGRHHGPGCRGVAHAVQPVRSRRDRRRVVPHGDERAEPLADAVPRRAAALTRSRSRCTSRCYERTARDRGARRGSVSVRRRAHAALRRDRTRKGLAVSLGSTGSAAHWRLPVGDGEEGAAQSVSIANFAAHATGRRARHARRGDCARATDASTSPRTVSCGWSSAIGSRRERVHRRCAASRRAPFVVEAFGTWAAPAPITGVTTTTGLGQRGRRWAFADRPSRRRDRRGDRRDQRRRAARSRCSSTRTRRAIRTARRAHPLGRPPGERAVFTLSEIGIRPGPGHRRRRPTGRSSSDARSSGVACRCLPASPTCDGAAMALRLGVGVAVLLVAGVIAWWLRTATPRGAAARCLSDPAPARPCRLRAARGAWLVAYFSSDDLRVLPRARSEGRRPRVCRRGHVRVSFETGRDLHERYDIERDPDDPRRRRRGRGPPRVRRRDHGHRPVGRGRRSQSPGSTPEPRIPEQAWQRVNDAADPDRSGEPGDTTSAAAARRTRRGYGAVARRGTRELCAPSCPVVARRLHLDDAAVGALDLAEPTGLASHRRRRRGAPTSSPSRVSLLEQRHGPRRRDRGGGAAGSGGRGSPPGGGCARPLRR